MHKTIIIQSIDKLSSSLACTKLRHQIALVATGCLVLIVIIGGLSYVI